MSVEWRWRQHGVVTVQHALVLTAVMLAALVLPAASAFAASPQTAASPQETAHAAHRDLPSEALHLRDRSDCLVESRLRQRLAQELVGLDAASDALSLDVVAWHFEAMRSDPESFQADVHARHAQDGVVASRRLEAKTCAELEDAVILASTLMWTDSANWVGPVSRGNSDALTKAWNSRGWWLGVDLAGRMQWNVMPETAYGVGGELAAGQDRWSVRVGGTWLAPQTVAVPNRDNLRARYSQLASEARGCGMPAHKRFSATHSLGLELCAGLGTHRVSATGDGAVVTKSATEWWASGNLTAGATWQLFRHGALKAEIGTDLPFERVRFVVLGLGDVHRVGVASVRGGVAWETRF